LLKIAERSVGAVVGSLRVSRFVVLSVAALLVAATPENAEAQFYPWGMWGNPQPKPRRARRVAPRFAEPNDDAPVRTTLPKPTGPLVIVVSLNSQTVTVYDDGKQIAKSPISSGMPGHPTPTGVFSILEKNRIHHSNLYGGAPMPFMQRVTNSGVAMHAGELPGYAASHGCVRLPYSFARDLFGITDVGARVIISEDDLTPAEFNSPHLIAPLPPDNTASNNGTGAVPAAASGEQADISNMLANPSASGVRTRGMAAAARAAERSRLVSAIAAAENAKLAADDQAKAATAAAQEGKETIRKERQEQDRLAELARKAAKAAAAAASQFTEITAQMSKLDVSKVDPATLEKQTAEEVAEETKMLDAADAATAAQRAADAQAAKTKQAIADAGALDKARKVAVEDADHAVAGITAAKDAVAAADALEARKNYPVSVFISGKTGRLIAKLGFVQVMDVPVTIAEPGRPLGTHVLTATAFTNGEKALRWNALTLKQEEAAQYVRRKNRRHEDEAPIVAGGHDADAATALERIQIPKEAEEQLAELMKPGSSFIISDYGLSRETSARTEFVVEPWRSRPDSAETRYY
jgi:lipoprotein-anchoring transpeptidase ErfK/SrfK